MRVKTAQAVTQTEIASVPFLGRLEKDALSANQDFFGDHS
jgi:hypothetical protein